MDFMIFFLVLLPSSLLLLLFLLVRPRPVEIPIKNRHVLITGGSSGIGLALARQFASEGARVSILARNRRKLEEAAEEIRRTTGVDVTVFSADVRDFDAVKRVVEEAGALDFLVCNQGMFFAKEYDRQDIEEIKLMVDVNLMGTLHMIRAALPSMKATRGARGPAVIAITSSLAGQVGLYGYVAYSATKFGLKGMAEALQQEVIQDDIHVSVVFAPATRTPALTEDYKRKPVINRILTESASIVTADHVAEKAIAGIKRGAFLIPCNFDGVLLSLTTAGMSPQRSYLKAFLEVLGASFMRFVAFLYQWYWYSIIKRERNKNNKAPELNKVG